MKKLDYCVLLMFLVALFVISLIWRCEFDAVVTIIALMIAAITGFATHVQYKMLKELGKAEEAE